MWRLRLFIGMAEKMFGYDLAFSGAKEQVSSLAVEQCSHSNDEQRKGE